MDISDRIRMILKSQQLSAGEFADRIGVQRSSISHILSGRNKPGFDFIQKVVENFPKIDPYWLLTGKTKNSNSVEVESAGKEESVLLNQRKEGDASGVSRAVQSQKQDSSKKIVKVVLFYDDFSFESYQP